MKFLCNFEWSSDHGHNMYLANGVWLIILLKNEWLIQSDKIKVNMTKNKSTTLTTIRFICTGMHSHIDGFWMATLSGIWLSIHLNAYI